MRMSESVPTLGVDARAEARAAVKSVRQAWRESLLPAKLLGEHTRLGRRAGVVWRELDIFEDRIQEAGGEDALMALVCAHVATNGSIGDFCAHYGLDQGLLGAFIAEKPERMEWFHNALRWTAEVDVSGTVQLADAATTEDYKVRALQIGTRFKRAGVYAPARFGDKAVGVPVTPVGGTPTSITVTFVDARDGRPVIEGSSVEGV